MPSGVPLIQSGMTFEKWSVVKRAYRSNKTTYWWCFCSCGNPVAIAVSGNNLRSHSSKSCGCHVAVTRREKQKLRTTDEHQEVLKLRTQLKGLRYSIRHRKDRGAYAKEWRKRNPQKVFENNRGYTGTVNYLLSKARQRARGLGIEFSLTASDIHIPAICPVLGIPIFSGKGQAHAGSPSLDRINNLLGYRPDNVKVISLRANQLKRDASIEEVEKILNYMKKEQSCSNKIASLTS